MALDPTQISPKLRFESEADVRAFRKAMAAHPDFDLDSRFEVDLVLEVYCDHCGTIVDTGCTYNEEDQSIQIPTGKFPLFRKDAEEMLAKHKSEIHDEAVGDSWMNVTIERARQILAEEGIEIAEGDDAVFAVVRPRSVDIPPVPPYSCYTVM